MSLLLTADLHLTSRPQDEYRWSVFKELRRLAKKHSASVAILGDLTDEKDHHDARLVNRVVRELERLEAASDSFPLILCGNHDYAVEDHPYFRFLPGFIPKPSALEHGGVKGLYLPHVRHPMEAWDAEVCKSLAEVDAVFIHQPIVGCDGIMEGAGITVEELHSKFKVPVFAGDIHRPQEPGKGITYVGAPHPIRFGDHWQPRFLLLTRKEGALTVTSINRKDFMHKVKMRVTSLDDLRESLAGLNPGDQARVLVSLPAKKLSRWPKFRNKAMRLVRESGIALHGIELLVEGRAPEKRKTKEATALMAPALVQEYGEAVGLDPFIVSHGMELINAGT